MVFITTVFHYSVFPLPLASTSADCGSLPLRQTQTFLPEEFGLLAVLPGLDCCRFPLTLITGYGDIKRCPKGSLVIQTECIPHLHCGAAV